MTITEHSLPEKEHQLCSINLLGNLVAIPEIRYMANPAIALAEFAVATTHKWQDKQTKAWKEWSSFHHIKAVGEPVERALRFAQKGDLILLQGYIADVNNKSGEIIHANNLEHFAKGYAQSINQITLSGNVSSNVKLMSTEQNIPFCTFEISCRHFAYSEQKQAFIAHDLVREVHAWGKQATYLSQQADLGSALIVEGRLSYSNDSQKKQFIEATRCHKMMSA